MVFFDQNEFINKYNNGVPQILSSKLIADTETPVSTLLKISTNQKYSFLLESVEGGDQRGRYSLLGCDPDLIWQVKKGKIFVKTNDKVLNEKINLNLNPVESLKNILNLSKVERNPQEVPYPILVGYLGYPMIQHMEKIKLNNPDSLMIPDAVMIRPKIAAVFDNIKDTINIMTVVYPQKNIMAKQALEIATSNIDISIQKLSSEIKKDKHVKIKNSEKKEDLLKH